MYLTRDPSAWCPVCEETADIKIAGSGGSLDLSDENVDRICHLLDGGAAVHLAGGES